MTNNTSSPAAPQNTPAFVDGKPDEETISVDASFYEHGRNVARSSMDLEANPEAEAALEAFADRAAARLDAAPFNPAANFSDRLEHEHHDRLLERHKLAARSVDEAALGIRDAEEARGRVATPLAGSAVVFVVALFAALAFAFIASFTFHDVLFAGLLKVAAQAVVASLIAGGVFGGMASAYASVVARHTSCAPLKSLLFAVLEASFCGAGFFLLRYSLVSGSDTHHALCVALGLSMLEVLCFLVLRGAAFHAAQVRSEVAAVEADIERADAAVVAATALHARLLASANELDARIEAHRKSVRRREHHVRSAPLIRAAACTAVVAGYRHGIEENRARMAGARPTGAALPFSPRARPADAE